MAQGGNDRIKKYKQLVERLTPNSPLGISCQRVLDGRVDLHFGPADLSVRREGIGTDGGNIADVQLHGARVPRLHAHRSWRL